MITQFKIFEKKYNYSSMEPFLIEYDIVQKIVDFIKKYNLEYIDDIKIYGDVYYIFLGKVGSFDDVLLKCKQLNADEPTDIMVGIPRFKGVDVHESILKQIEKLTEEDIERLKTIQDVKKYNL